MAFAPAKRAESRVLAAFWADFLNLALGCATRPAATVTPAAAFLRPAGLHSRC
jgi:hypothetical protein